MGMPLYRVWYRDIEEPIEFSTATRTSEAEIVAHVLAHDNVAAAAGPGAAPSVKELIARHKLAPLRYTEDESEINNIS
jgi:hypothetical protein